MDQLETLRTGYDPAFLGDGDPDVTVPVPTRPGLSVLDYVHFSVHQDTERRLAAITAVNLDGSRLREVGRSDSWRLDPRLPAEHQAGEELYARNDLDRGHLVRRRDPVWGEDQVARQANRDTFHYTVCAPQAGYFNQSAELWLGVEDHVLEHARAADQRLSVFTGCVFDPEDPVYRGVQVPRRFFKIVAWDARPDAVQEQIPDDAAPSAAGPAAGGAHRLGSTGYLLDQGEGLNRILVRGLRPDQEVPGPGPFRTFQVPVADIAELTGLQDEAMDLLRAADRYRVPAAEHDEEVQGVRVLHRWRELSHADQIML